jgi:DeoR family transcriptional regulator, ulaG and ulaABCDEF operon transcriptional repressor
MSVKMHAAERDRLILNLLGEQGFVSFRELSRRITASPATLRRDLERLQTDGKLVRVRGGVQPASGPDSAGAHHLKGVPFNENINRNRAAKEAIGKAAAALCRQGEAIIIDGGSTTLHMCPHLEYLRLQVLTNSLHIVSALLQHASTGISITGGVVFREQNIVLDPFEDVDTRIFHASRMFVGAAAVTRYGLMQNDIILVQAERKLFNQADEVIVLVDSSKFLGSAGHLLCELSRVNTLITDSKISTEAAKMVESQGVKLITVDV